MADKEPCLIGPKMTIRGQISGNQDLLVEGRIEGQVNIQNRIVVEAAGSLEADLQVVDADVKGTVRGDIVASRSAVLHPSARVVGNIRSPRVVIESGAKFSGTIEMDVELPPDAQPKAK
jgi:cytoskeletal protein CcmA (bactofilin family)